jgi:hypothetical protein
MCLVSDAQLVFRGTPVCHEIFSSHCNYNNNETNNCFSCFLLCLSFHFLYYSRTDRGQTRSTKWNWKVTHPPPLTPPPPTICKMGLVCRHDSSTIFRCASVERSRNTGLRACQRGVLVTGSVRISDF